MLLETFPYVAIINASYYMHVHMYIHSYVGWLVQCYCSLLSWHAIRPCPSNLNLLKSNNIFGHRHTHAHTQASICMYMRTHIHMHTNTHTHTHISDRPIMLIFYVPIMLCCSAHKIYLLCTILCSRIRNCYHYSYTNLYEYKHYL